MEKEITLKDIILKLKHLLIYFLENWKLILCTCLIGAVLGITYGYLKKPLYTAECTFVIEEEGRGGLGQYAGLASMVGIDVGGSSNGLFQSGNLLELYKSRTMITETLLSKDEWSKDKSLLIDRYIKFNHLRDNWSADSTLSTINFNIPREKFTYKHDSILGNIVLNIRDNYLSVGKPDKELSILSVKVKSKDELFAKAFADKIVNNVNDFYINTKTKKSLDNVHILQMQSDSLRNILNRSINGVATAIDANPNINAALQILRTPSQRRQIDVQSSSAIYAEITKNLEIAKVSLRKERPLIQVIDPPILPLKVEKPSVLKSMILGSILFGIVILIFLTLKMLSKKILILT